VPLPEFNEHGDLPAGLHAATLAEVLKRFGESTAQRAAVAQRLTRIHQLAVATGHVRRFVVFGSFVTSKPHPNDVDIFIVMDDDFDFSQTRGETRLLLEHGTAQSHFGASVFWLRQVAAYNGEDAAIADWQIKRDGTERGIIEIILD
jgi:predicted nucleotidyltransferase